VFVEFYKDTCDFVYGMAVYW